MAASSARDRRLVNKLVRYGSCTYREIAEFAANGAIAVVPLGCTEQQGPHLPVDFDSWFAETLMLESVEDVEVGDGLRVLVLPVIPLGPTPEHRGFGADFTAYSDSGVIGDPGHASAALGERLWRACTDWVARYLRDTVAPGDDSPSRVR